MVSGHRVGGKTPDSGRRVKQDDWFKSWGDREVDLEAAGQVQRAETASRRGSRESAESSIDMPSSLSVSLAISFRAESIPDTRSRPPPLEQSYELTWTRQKNLMPHASTPILLDVSKYKNILLTSD